MARSVIAEQLELDALLSESTPANERRPSSRPAGRTKRRGAAEATRNDGADVPKRGATRRPSSAELLVTPGELLTRSHLRQLGLERRAIDAVFRSLPVVSLPGYSRPMVRAEQYLELIAQHTYRDDRVRPCHA